MHINLSTITIFNYIIQLLLFSYLDFFFYMFVFQLCVRFVFRVYIKKKPKNRSRLTKLFCTIYFFLSILIYFYFFIIFNSRLSLSFVFGFFLSSFKKMFVTSINFQFSSTSYKSYDLQLTYSNYYLFFSSYYLEFIIYLFKNIIL